MSPRKATLKYHIGRLGPANWKRINKGDDEEYRAILFRTCREAIKSPFPLGPYPALIQGRGWVRMELSPDPPHPYLRIQNGYELQLEVPKKAKFFKVFLYKEYFDRNKLEMVIRRTPTASIYLHGLYSCLLF